MQIARETARKFAWPVTVNFDEKAFVALERLRDHFECSRADVVRHAVRRLAEEAGMPA